MPEPLLLFAAEMERTAFFEGWDGPDIATALVGVGVVEAAIRTAQVVVQRNPESLCFIGTAGTFDEATLSIGEFAVAKRAVLASAAVVDGLSRVPSIQPSECECSLEIAHRILPQDVKSAKVVCTLGITESTEMATTLSASGDLENLEIFGVARAAGGCPIAGIFAVSNVVGPGGGTAWRTHYRSTLARLGGLASRHMRNNGEL